MRAHQAQGRLGARFPNTKLLARVLTPRRLNLPPARQCPKPGRLDWSAGCALSAQNSVTNPKRLDSPATRARVSSQSGWSRRLRVPRTELLEWLINGLIDCQGPHLQNSEECDPGREKSETNPSNHHLPLHRQDTSRYNLTGLKPAEDFFFIFFLFFPFPLNSFFRSPFFLFFHSFFLPTFTIFMSSSCLLLSISMF